MAAVITDQLGRHGFETTAVKQVQKKRRKDVIAVVSECDAGRAKRLGHPVQNAAPQPRTERAHGLTVRNVALNDAVSILIFNMKWDVAPAQIRRQDLSRKTGLLLVQIHRDQLKINRRALAQTQEQIEHRVTVFAARHTDHDPIARADHIEVSDRLTYQTVQPLGELVALALDGGAHDCAHAGVLQRVISTVTASTSAKACGLSIATRTQRTGRAARMPDAIRSQALSSK